MRKCGCRSIGLCSWSLGKDYLRVAELMGRLDIEYVHLGIRECLGKDGQVRQIKDIPWKISSTMIDFPQEDYTSLESIEATGGISPDDCWPRNKDIFVAAAQTTALLDVRLLSTHIGFIDYSRPKYALKMGQRVGCLADIASKNGLTLLMETGQETAAELKTFLEELGHPAIGVNFDPANMILYGRGEPTEAAEILAGWIKHVHIKDAVRACIAGTWGSEVAWGSGQVGAEKFLAVLGRIGFNGVLAIEREAGDNRLEDIKMTAEKLSEMSF